MKAERPITRESLATFIEYAAQDAVTGMEWSWFAVNHYHDRIMEDARRDCVRIMIEANKHGRRKKLPAGVIDRLYAIADRLRSGAG